MNTPTIRAAGPASDDDYVKDHPLLAALVVHEAVRKAGHVSVKGADSRLLQLLEMTGIRTRSVIVNVRIEGDVSEIATELYAPQWAVQVGSIVSALMNSSTWPNMYDGHKLVLLMRKARRDAELRAELLAVPRLTGNNKQDREALQHVLGGLVEKHLRAGDGD